MRSTIIAAALLLGTGSAASAACSTRDFAGDWRLESSSGVVCAIRGLANGKIQKSYCVVGASYVGKIGGKLSISRTCIVKGTINQNFPGAKGSFKVSGRMNAARTFVSGKSTGKLGKFAFRAYKYR